MKQQYLDILKEKVFGKIIAAHDEKGHHYKFVESGSIVDSVTTKNIIQKEHLIAWAVKLGVEFLEQENRFEALKDPERRSDVLTAALFKYKDFRDDAGDVGTVAHHIIEAYIEVWTTTGTRPSNIIDYVPNNCDPRAVAAARCASAAFDKYPELEPLACEMLVGIDGVSAGTLDLLMFNNITGEVELWDWKTSNNIDDFYWLQISAYAEMLRRMTDNKISITNARIIKLDKFSNRPKIYRVENLDNGYQLFETLSYFYDGWRTAGSNIIEDKKVVYLQI